MLTVNFYLMEFIILSLQVQPKYILVKKIFSCIILCSLKTGIVLYCVPKILTFYTKLINMYPNNE